jgi:hypothetical protein
MSEGNLIGFRVFFDSSGNLMTEFNQVPAKEINKIFKEPEEQKIIATVLEQAQINFEGLHLKIEKELDALNTRIV